MAAQQCCDGGVAFLFGQCPARANVLAAWRAQRGVKGRAHARCQTVEYGVFVHPLVLSSGAHHGPRIARPHGVTVLKLELSASTTTQAPAAMGAEGLITQEVLPAKPDSGSGAAPHRCVHPGGQQALGHGAPCHHVDRWRSKVPCHASARAGTAPSPKSIDNGVVDLEKAGYFRRRPARCQAALPPKWGRQARVLDENGRLQAPFGCWRPQAGWW